MYNIVTLKRFDLLTVNKTDEMTNQTEWGDIQIWSKTRKAILGLHSGSFHLKKILKSSLTN